MGDEIRPALTPEGWATMERVGFVAAGGAKLEGGVLSLYETDGGELDPSERHELAALALHDQPFGFSWEDVDRLRGACLDERGTETTEAQLHDLADRIAALLPPRDG